MRRPEHFLAALAAFAVVQTAWGFHELPECGEAEAPQCNGECPSGRRCTQVEDFSAVFIRLIVNTSANGPQQGQDGDEPSCACLEVPCGGIPLEDGEACCNGKVINASEECDCSLEPLLFACCARTEVNGSIQDTQLSQYTYNLPLDCCAGTTCGGTCRGAECATSDCCVCEGIEACAGADSDVGCVAACFFSPEGLGIFQPRDGVRIEGGTCGAEGCIPPTAAAPAASSTGLGVSIVCLAAIGVLALVRRRRRQS